MNINTILQQVNAMTEAPMTRGDLERALAQLEPATLSRADAAGDWSAVCEAVACAWNWAQAVKA